MAGLHLVHRARPGRLVTDAAGRAAGAVPCGGMTRATWRTDGAALGGSAATGNARARLRTIRGSGRGASAVSSSGISA